MPAQCDTISLRTARLNNIIVGKGLASGVITKASVRRSTNLCAISAMSGVWNVVTREGLLDAFCLLYSECDKESLKKKDRNIADFVNKYRTVVERTRQLRVNSEDFAVKTQIGKGHYGNVHLVVECQTGDVYAMKKIMKSVVTATQIKEERDIMARRCSEWITNLQYAFQDTDHLYLIMEFLPGGDLLSLMSRHGAFDEDLTRFYLAELALAIHSLHKMGYIHRDIKPENILIDRFGHIKLADFGNAAALDRDGHVVSLSPVGTPDYIAPELLQTISTYKVTKSLHNVSSDFWSMGIIGYELICEVTPFHEENVHETYSKILSYCEDSTLKEIISFPSSLELSTNYKNLIESLITNPTSRLGFTEIKYHTFFTGVKWESLRSQVPPIIPTVNGEDDISNFEVFARNRLCSPTQSKKSPTTTGIKSNDFSGKDLPFIGYSFVHIEQMNSEANVSADDARVAKLSAKVNELQAKLIERSDQVSRMNYELLHAQHMSTQSTAQAKTLEDAKEEINRLKDIVKEKTAELGNTKATLKKFQNTMKVEAEMWEKKEVAIAEMLRMNRQKYEEAKTASEQRYEKVIAEKKNELLSLTQKLDARESEFQVKSDECVHRNKKMENYKEMLRQAKLQAQTDKEQFELNKRHLSESYDNKLLELRNKLSNERESKTRLSLKFRSLRTEFDESISSSKSSQEAQNAASKIHDDMLKRLNAEIESNNKLHAQNTKLEQQLVSVQKASQELEQQIGRLERELQVAECGQNLAQSMIASQASPYETAPGSLTELHLLEDQLRDDLNVARENESVQTMRANELQTKVDNLEAMLEKRALPSSTKTELHLSSCKPEKKMFDDQLLALHDQIIEERQSARSANLALWRSEKRLEEAHVEQKLTQRRMELTEDRIKKIRTEYEDTKLRLKASEAEIRSRDERIQELKSELATLKCDVGKQQKMRENAEEQRLQIKTEIIGHISKVHMAEEHLSVVRDNLQQSHRKCESLCVENKRLTHELAAAHEQQQVDKDVTYELQLKLKCRNDDYERLKYACTITEKQITEVEAMLDAEQRRCKTHQAKNQELYVNLQCKNETITELRKQLQEEKSQCKAIEAHKKMLSEENMQLKLSHQELKETWNNQQKEMCTTIDMLNETQDRVEALDTDVRTLRAYNSKHEHMVAALKEENSKILTDCFCAKEKRQRLETELKEALDKLDETQAELQELQQLLTEKEHFFLQRDIKSEATLAQHKKLIDYLQIKLEDHMPKKKKTIADMFFGSSSFKKENISPPRIKSSILYRTLNEELNREKQRNKGLQEQIEHLNGAPKSALKQCDEQYVKVDSRTVGRDTAEIMLRKASGTTRIIAEACMKGVGRETSSSFELHHCFELTLLNAVACASVCIACKDFVVEGSPCWRCKECMGVAHRKCRANVRPNCGVSEDQAQPPEFPAAINSDSDAVSVGKYSYEAKLNEKDGADVQLGNDGAYTGVLIFSEQRVQGEPLQVNCAYEIEANKILLLGCTSGLFSYHIEPQQLVHIDGVDSVHCFAVSVVLSKAIMISVSGDSLYQCDFRQLQSRSHANAAFKQILEASRIELPFTDCNSGERWQQVKISDVAVEAIASVAIATTASLVIIMTYDLEVQKFQPVRALDTVSPALSILFTPLTAIVASNKFFEIDLDSQVAEEFVDLSDQSLAQTRYFQPMTAISITTRELLLCFNECGIFVDTFGNRSRPHNLNWSCNPTGFLYREPFLYISYEQLVQVMRLHRSYSKGSDAIADIDSDEEDGGLEPSRTCVKICIHNPKLLTGSGKFDAYVLAGAKNSGPHKIFYLDPFRAFKEQLNVSFSSISSKGTMLTMDSSSTM